MIYFGIWFCFYGYALISGLSAADFGRNATSFMSGVERFLPLQAVAAIAAVAVFLCGQRLRRSKRFRVAAYVPVTATIVGAVLTVGVAGAAGVATEHTQATPTIDATSTDDRPLRMETILISF